MAEKSRLPKTVTLGELMELLNITRQAIDRNVAAGIIIKVGRDAYDIKSVPRYCAHTRAGGDLSPERRRFAAARARKAELETAVLEGRYVPADQVATTWRSILLTVRSHMLAIPSKIAARVGMCKGAVEVQALLRREIEEALLELSKVTFVGQADEKV